MYEMLSKILAVALLGFAFAAEEGKNSKRSITALGFPSWNSVLGHSWGFWQPNVFPHGSMDSFSSVHPGKEWYLGLIPQHTTPDIAAAVAAAKKATAAAALARRRVQAAREHVAVQEKAAAEKEAAARAAIRRSEALAAAAAQESGAASAVSAAHFTSAPWATAKPAYNHWA